MLTLPTGIVVTALTLYAIDLAPAQPYQTSNEVLHTTDTCVGDHGWHSWKCRSQRRTRYYQAFLEYRDNGTLYDRDRRSLIIQKINELSSQNDPMLVVVYVNGWNHSAKPTDTNVLKFKDMLARHHDAARRATERRVKHPAERKVTKLPVVLGIYVGWNGDKDVEGPCKLHMIWPFDKACSFFERSKAADYIGTSGDHGCDSSNFKCDLRRISDELHRNPAGRMIVYGHSLGGRILTRAFQPDFTKGQVRPLGDRTLMVTINAAVGADCFTPSFGRTAHPNHPPTWLNFTSDNDAVTSSYYGWARRLGYTNACNENLSESAKTIGHYDPYLTHFVSFKQRQTAFAPAKRRQTTLVPAKRRQITFVPAPPNAEVVETNPRWFLGTPQNHLLAYLWRKPLSECPPPQSSCYREQSADLYEMTFEARKGFGKFGALWNIVTDGNGIQIADDDARTTDGYADHNGYVQTNLTRLLLEILYAQ